MRAGVGKSGCDFASLRLCVKSSRVFSHSKAMQTVLRYRAWVFVALTVLLVLAVRVRLREMPLERDEGEYAYAGQLILQGVPPYKEIYNMKLPGTYAAYALIMAVFGQSPAGIHLGVMLVNAGSIVLIFLLGRKLLDETAGVVAAASYGLLSLSPSVLGLAGHATHFVVLPALGGTLLLLKAVDGSSQIKDQPPSSTSSAKSAMDVGKALRRSRSSRPGDRVEGREPSV